MGKMQEEHFEFEDMVINRMSLLDSINQLAPEIQKWILEEYGDFKTFSEMIENKERVCELFEFLIAKKWTGRKQKVIFLRFGIIDGKPRSLEEVAAIIGEEHYCFKRFSLKC